MNVPSKTLTSMTVSAAATASPPGVDLSWEQGHVEGRFHLLLISCTRVPISQRAAKEERETCADGHDSILLMLHIITTYSTPAFLNTEVTYYD